MILQTEADNIPEVAVALEKFGERLLSQERGNTGGSLWPVSGPESFGKSGWANPENIDSGACGIILLLAAWYETTGDRRYLDGAIQSMENVIAYCRKNESNNFSLYTGRGGVAMTLIRLFDLSGDQRFLTIAIDLMKGAGDEYLESAYVSDFLYDGRAGTLLVLMHLYAITGKRPVLGWIRAIATKIIQNSGINDRGFYWERSAADNYTASGGFAFGSGGIGYVFAELSGCFKDAASLVLYRECRKYRDRSWDQRLSCWIDRSIRIEDCGTFQKYYENFENERLFGATYEYSWMYGIAGIGIARLNAPEPSSGKEDTLNNVLPKLIQYIQEDKIESLALADGLAGVGMFLLRAYRADPQDILLRALEKIARRLARALEAHICAPEAHTRAPESEGTEGLLHGIPGAAWFCLHYRSLDQERFDILDPHLPKKKKEADNGTGVSPFTLLEAPSGVYKAVLATTFKRTMQLALHLIPNELNVFLEDAGTRESVTEAFAGFLSSLPASTPNYECLADLLRLECSRVGLTRLVKRDRKAYIREIKHYERINRIFSQEEWYSHRRIQITDNVHIITTKWDWTTEYLISPGKFNPVDVIDHPPGLYSTLLFISADGRVVEQPITLIESILEIFKQPKTASEAMDEIGRYFAGVVDRRQRASIVTATGCEDYSDFLKRSNYLVKHNLQQLVFDNVLEFL